MARHAFLLAIIAGLAVAAVVATEPHPVVAHPGGVNAEGCHTCRTNCPAYGLATGDYHCHDSAAPAADAGAIAGASPPPDVVVPVEGSSTSAVPQSPLEADAIPLTVVGVSPEDDEPLVGALRIAAFASWGVFGAVAGGAGVRWVARRRAP